MEFAIHPFTKILSATIFLAVVVLIISNPTSAAAQDLECEYCVYEYETCLILSEAVYYSCLDDCESGDPSEQTTCEVLCNELFELNQLTCWDDYEFCLWAHQCIVP